MATKGYKIENNNGELNINYKTDKGQTENQYLKKEIEYNSNKESFGQEIKKGAPTQEQQAEKVQHFLKDNSNTEQEKHIDRNSR